MVLDKQSSSRTSSVCSELREQLILDKEKAINQALALIGEAPPASSRRQASTKVKSIRLGKVTPKKPTLLTLKQVVRTLRLSEAQIVLLCKRWNFPLPILNDGQLAFTLHEVREWAEAQPDKDDFAAVLKLRRRYLLA